jgi:trigger factor
LKIEKTPCEDHQVKMTVQIEPDQFEKSMHQAARKIANRVKIPGFRPGKAPYDIIIRNVGEETVKTEAIDILIDDIYPKALKETNLTPGAMGKLENISEEIPPVFEFLVPLAPEVKLGDYKSIRKDYQKPSIDQKEVDDFVDRLRMNYATSEPVEREARRGDIVYLNLSGSIINPAEGQNPVLIKEGAYPVFIPDKESKDTDWPYPGFGETLIGKSMGSEGSSNYIYPEDNDLEDMRGKNVEFKYKIESVKKLVLPEVDEAFLQMLGEQKSVEDFMKSIKDQLEQRKATEYDREYASDLVEQIRKQATIKYPPQLVNDEIGELIKSLEHDLERQKLDLTTYLKTRNLEKEAFIEQEVKPVAIDRLERSLVMDEFSHTEQIKLDMSKWEDAINETARDLSYSTDNNKLQKKMSKDQLSEAVTYETANRLMNKQIFECMKAIATGTYIETQNDKFEKVDKSDEPRTTKKKSPSSKAKVKEDKE